MFKRILLAAALVSSSAIAQEVDINGKDFLSGAGDARLADIARQAAAQGKRVVVTAPDYWQSKIAAKLHAGASNIDVQMKEGFFENVLVRIDDGKAAAAAKADADKAAATRAEASKAEAARAEGARLEAARADAERAEVQRAEAQRVQAAKEQADRAEAARIEAQKAEAARAEAVKVEAARAEAAKAAAAKAKAEKDAADRLVAIKQRMQQNLAGGHEAEGTLNVSQLQKDDELFIDGPIRGVVRREGARSRLFWLDGDLNLERVELLPVVGKSLQDRCANSRYGYADASHQISGWKFRRQCTGTEFGRTQFARTAICGRQAGYGDLASERPANRRLGLSREVVGFGR